MCRLGKTFVKPSHRRLLTPPSCKNVLQGQKHGPHSISQFRRWLEGLAERPDLHAEHQAFKSITVFRPDRPQGVPLMMLLK